MITLAGDLPSHTLLPPLGWYQIILLGDRAKSICIHKTVAYGEFHVRKVAVAVVKCYLHRWSCCEWDVDCAYIGEVVVNEMWTVLTSVVKLLWMRCGLCRSCCLDKQTWVCSLQTSQHDTHEPPLRASPTYNAIHSSHWAPCNTIISNDSVTE